ncbi:hypothetical protein CPJCM30710_12880 [Clostridium polyendosporum]|uniref:Uncharacterized protein n=1 Tax=Clostridium polyendosporum TaxID=69208 RepID=A0A919VFX6_9CLOT|nr:hypothetical protein [Clostridium polyendosporum]GIM28622.1 hypothetical protein CPJCM30710_12880 [Clostridium polyendosporum]
MKRHGKGTKSTKHRKHNKHHRDKENDIRSNQSENLHNHNEQNNNDENEDRQHILIPGHVPGGVPGAPAPITGVAGVLQPEIPPTEVKEVTEGAVVPSVEDQISNAITKTALVKTSIESIQVDDIERIYFDRKVRPLLDTVQQLSTAVINFSTSANLYQANAFADKKEIKRALKIAYDVTDEFEDIWKILKIRLDRFKNNIDPCE